MTGIDLPKIRFKELHYNSGFTMVEFIVVIAIIGILATLVIVSYTGITHQANIATLKSDLNGAYKLFTLYRAEYNSYPQTINCYVAGENDPPNKCIEPTPGNRFEYYYNNTQSFRLCVLKNGTNLRFCITDENSSPTVPADDENVPTIASVNTPNSYRGGMLIRANITSNGGSDIVSRGTCWGVLPKPTTNCSEAPKTSVLATGESPSDVIISSDDKSVYVAN